jgi:hypothetical protein
VADGELEHAPLLRAQLAERLRRARGLVGQLGDLGLTGRRRGEVVAELGGLPAARARTAQVV